MQASTRIRLAARTLLPQRNWGPIEAWDDARYNKLFRKLKASDEELLQQKLQSMSLKANGAPTFSIIVPLYQTSPDGFADMAESVLAQTYPFFELILVNASPEDKDLRSLSHEYVQRDQRVKLVELDGNYGITQNTNHGIAQASGDFVCFLDHDDWIEPNALFEYAQAVLENPAIDMLYSDEDLVVRKGADWYFSNPSFKPAYSPEYLLCVNYIIHFLSIRKSIVDAMPTPGPQFDGSQDYNMTLFASERARAVHHVAKVLYHWRISESSTAKSIEDKPYAKRANRLAMQQHYSRTGLDAALIGTGMVSLHTPWFADSSQKCISLIVDARANNAAFFLEAFLQTNTYPAYEIMLACTPQQNEDLSTFIEAINAHEGASITIYTAEEQDSATAVLSKGAQGATGDILVFLNGDCAFTTPQALAQIAGVLGIEGVGVVGPRVLYADLTVKSYGVGVTAQNVMPLYRGYDRTDPSYHARTRVFQNVSALGWQGLAVSKELFNTLGGFDDAFSCEIAAVDFCYRALEQQQRIAVISTVEITTTEWPTHPRFSTDGTWYDYPAGDKELLYKKWPAICAQGDRYLSWSLCQKTGYPAINADIKETR